MNFACQFHLKGSTEIRRREASPLLAARPIDRNFNARRGDVPETRSGHAFAVRERKFVTGKLAWKERVTMAARTTMTKVGKEIHAAVPCVAWHARDSHLDDDTIERSPDMSTGNSTLRSGIGGISGEQSCADGDVCFLKVAIECFYV